MKELILTMNPKTGSFVGRINVEDSRIKSIEVVCEPWHDNNLLLTLFSEQVDPDKKNYTCLHTDLYSTSSLVKALFDIKLDFSEVVKKYPNFYWEV